MPASVAFEPVEGPARRAEALGVRPWSVRRNWSTSFESWPGICGGPGSRTSSALFRELDPALWRKVDHNPVEFLKRLPVEQLERRAAEMALDSRIDYAFRRLAEYLQDTDSWGSVHASILRPRPVAYFSAEFGLHESLPIYSGGLGVLAGDHLKSASDLGIPLIGVGLLYAQGYFRQTLDANGWQQELYLNADPDLLPIESVTGPGRQAADGRDRDDHRRAARAGLAGRGRPDHAAACSTRTCPRTASRTGR